MAGKKKSEFSDEFWEKWKKVYEELGEDEYSEDVYYEHFCLGFCMANGLSVENGLKFYHEAVNRGKGWF